MPELPSVSPITADELEQEGGRLTRVRGREGYEASEVDDLVVRLVRELRSTAPTMTAEDVDDVRLTPVRFSGPGYDMGEVDTLLDRAAQALRAKGAVRPPAATPETSRPHRGVPWATLVAVASLGAAVVAVMLLLG